MCGHVGVVSRNLQTKHRAFFEQGLYVDALRGMHATGVALIGANGKKTVSKKSLDSYTFLDLRTYDRMYNGGMVQYEVMMGHNRHATKGSLTDENAHPFTHGNITLAHNGSLFTMYQLPDHKEFVVDSDLIAYSINKIGVEETVKNLNGSFSLVYYNSSNKTINFIRNKERPMWIAKIKGSQTVFYGSEKWMVEGIATRKGIELEVEEIFQTEVGKLYSFDISDTKFYDNMQTKELELYKYKPANNSQNKGNVSHLPAPDKRKAKNRSIRSKHLLGQLGLKEGDVIPFEPVEFQAYGATTPNIGNLEGYMANDPYCDIVAYGVEMKDMRVMRETLCGEIVSATEYKKSILINVAPLTIRPFVPDIIDGEAEEVDDEFEFVGPNGIWITKHMFNELTKHGCGNCTGNIYDDDHQDLIWVNNMPICKQCQDANIMNYGSRDANNVH